MMSDLMREEFEAAFRKRFGFGRMTASANADADQMLKAAEWGWQASRERLVVELPKLKRDDDGDSWDPLFKSGADQCREAIHAAGVKTK